MPGKALPRDENDLVSSNSNGMSPKRILNVDLRYLPKCTEFFK